MRNTVSGNVPEEFQAFEKKIQQLEIGKSGKVGILDLEFETDKTYKTIITKQFSQPPLQIQRALYLENSIPEMAYIYLMTTSGGILQGDRYRTEISLKNNAMVHMTTQDATRIYGMNSNYASQIVNISIDDNCYLEYVPDQIIPYKNSRYYQEVNLTIHENSTLVYSEILTSGRRAMDESFEYDICYLKIYCKNQKNKIRFLENAKIEPKKQNLQDFGVLEKYNVMGSVYILTKKNKINKLQNLIHKSIPNTNSISFGTTILSDESGILIRILGKITSNVSEIIFKILEIVRKELLGASFGKIRKN